MRSPEFSFAALRAEAATEGYDPYRDYNDLRAFNPVWHAPWGDWYLSSFEAVTRALTSTECSSHRGLAQTSQQQFAARFFDQWLIFQDPPQHASLRRDLMGIFTPEHITVLEPIIRRIIMDLIPADAEATFDFVEALSSQVPVQVIADLIGMPRSDQPLVSTWGSILRDAFDDRDEGYLRLTEAVPQMRGYFTDLVNDPAWLSGPRKQYFVRVLNNNSADAVSAHLAFMVFAGHETTVHLLSSLMLILASRPAAWRSVRLNRALVKPAVEETLRFESPVQKLVRRTIAPIEICGTHVPENQSLVLLLGAANRDPKKFTRPDQYLLDRSAQGQIAFGTGAHLCLGRSLALLEADMLLRTLLDRWDLVDVEQGRWSWHTNSSFRGLERLTLSYRAEASDTM